MPSYQKADGQLVLSNMRFYIVGSRSVKLSDTVTKILPDIPSTMGCVCYPLGDGTFIVGVSQDLQSGKPLEEFEIKEAIQKAGIPYDDVITKWKAQGG